MLKQQIAGKVLKEISQLNCLLLFFFDIDMKNLIGGNHAQK